MSLLNETREILKASLSSPRSCFSCNVLINLKNILSTGHITFIFENVSVWDPNFGLELEEGLVTYVLMVVFICCSRR